MTAKSKKLKERKEILEAYRGSEIIVHTVSGMVIQGILVDYDALVIKVRHDKTIYLIPFTAIDRIVYYIKEDRIHEIGKK